MTGIQVGDTVAGYRIDAEAGRGGMGVVFRATQLRLGRTVALKAIAPELAANPDYRERFQREARLAASIEHPNVIPVYEANELDTGELYLAMRWIEGTDLRELLRVEDRLSPGHAVSILASVAQALDAAHARGLVHRDVKPANVLIAPEGGGEERVYLTDFGIARGPDEEPGLTKTGAFVGTLAYAAPERIRGERGGPPADIYALGCMLFETLTGRPPFNRKTELATMNAHLSEPVPSVRAEVPAVPARLDEVLRIALAKDPAERFKRAQDMAGAMQEAVLEPAVAETSAARPPTVQAGETGATTVLPGRQQTGPGRRAIWLALAAIAIAAGAIIVLTASGGGGRAGRTPRPAATPSRPTIRVTALGSLPSGHVPGVTAILDSNTIAVADPSGRDVVLLHRDGRPPEVIAVGGAPSAMAVDPSGRLWVAGSGGAPVTIIEPRDRQIVARLAAGRSPSAIAFGAGRAWIADRSSSQIAGFSLGTLKPDGRPIPTGGQDPVSLSFGSNGTLWVADERSSDVTAIRGGTVGTPRFIQDRPVSIAASAGGVWVGGAHGLVAQLSDSGVPSRPSFNLNAGTVRLAIADDSLFALSQDDATLAWIAPASGAGTVRARVRVAPAESPVALSCVAHLCVASDPPTRQVIAASF